MIGHLQSKKGWMAASTAASERMSDEHYPQRM